MPAAAGRAVEGGGGGLTSAAGAAAERVCAGAGCCLGRVPAVMRRHLGYALRLTGPQLRGRTAAMARGGGGVAGTCPRPGWLEHPRGTAPALPLSPLGPCRHRGGSAAAPRWSRGRAGLHRAGLGRN